VRRIGSLHWFSVLDSHFKIPLAAAGAFDKNAAAIGGVIV
jgi:hypothetical protein